MGQDWRRANVPEPFLCPFKTRAAREGAGPCGRIPSLLVRDWLPPPRPARPSPDSTPTSARPSSDLGALRSLRH